MSGHAHWKTIKRTKESEDKKRSQTFSRLSQMISIAVKEKGGDPQTNPSLRLIIEKAKNFNLPKENIERAIKRGTGEIKGMNFEPIIFEAYGPAKIAIIIEGITDNKNRALGEIKQALSQNNGKLVEEGSIKWLFEKKGCIIINLKTCLLPRPAEQDSPASKQINLKNKESLELTAIEAGAEDIYWRNGILDIYTAPEDLEQVKNNLKNQGLKIESSSLGWKARNLIKLKEKIQENIEKLFEALYQIEDVHEIYSNLYPIRGSEDEKYP